MKTEKIIEQENKYTIAGFKKRPIIIEKGEDCLVYDSEGNEYIDCIAGIGVANTGHCNKQVISAVKAQIDQLMVCPPMLHNEKRSELIKMLCDISQLDKAFLCNSGTEAVEAAIKFARVSTGKTDIIACVNSFHGRTMGSLALTWKKSYREPFEPVMPGGSHVAFNNFEKLKEKVTDKTAAIIIEIIQGEGGINIADKKYLTQVRALCDKLNILLIFDEVQTGMARTGKWFAHQHFDIKPDIMTLAKGIASGIPMGAVLCNQKIEVPDKLHANTFGGYPIACAASLATIEVIEKEKLCKKAKDLGDYFISKLRIIKSDKIREVRGLGLMIGVELKEKPTRIIKFMMDNGVLVMSSGLTVVRFLPPLTITKNQIDKVVEIFTKSLNLSGDKSG
jgi:predicted acetylornithine/succinylornithine family transaminase